MGGKIHAESVEACGSTFTFTLPFGQSKACKPAPISQSSSGSDNPCTPLRILVVDDIPINQLIAIKIIAKSGDHHIESACNGEEALEKWEHGDFDLIFMDVQMPVMDGLQATREIRLREKNRSMRTHISAMTANAMKEDMALCIEAGMDSFISKPIDAEKIYELISKISCTGGPALQNSENVTVRAGTEVITAEEESSPVDLHLQELLDRLDGDESYIRKFLELFIKTAYERISALGDAIAKGDCKAIRLEAHAIKGAASSITAEKIRIIAEKIESAAGESLLTVVEVEYATLQDAVESFKNVADVCMARLNV
jgi:CheY-like chemotaxis protein